MGIKTKLALSVILAASVIAAPKLWKEAEIQGHLYGQKVQDYRTSHPDMVEANRIESECESLFYGFYDAKRFRMSPEEVKQITSQIPQKYEKLLEQRKSLEGKEEAIAKQRAEYEAIKFPVITIDEGYRMASMFSGALALFSGVSLIGDFKDSLKRRREQRKKSKSRE